MGEKSGNAVIYAAVDAALTELRCFSSGTRVRCPASPLRPSSTKRPARRASADAPTAPWSASSRSGGTSPRRDLHHAAHALGPDQAQLNVALGQLERDMLEAERS